MADCPDRGSHAPAASSPGPPAFAESGAASAAAPTSEPSWPFTTFKTLLVQVLRKGISSIGKSDSPPEDTHRRAAVQVQILRAVILHFVKPSAAREEHPQQGEALQGGVAHMVGVLQLQLDVGCSLLFSAHFVITAFASRPTWSGTSSGTRTRPPLAARPRWQSRPRGSKTAQPMPQRRQRPQPTCNSSQLRREREGTSEGQWRRSFTWLGSSPETIFFDLYLGVSAILPLLICPLCQISTCQSKISAISTQNLGLRADALPCTLHTTLIHHTPLQSIHFRTLSLLSHLMRRHSS